MLKIKIFVFALSVSLAGALVAQDDKKELDVSAVMEQGLLHVQNEEFADAAEQFALVVKADADNGRAWQLYGFSLHGAGELDKAIVAHKKASEFDEFKGIALYNLGCAYSLKNDNDKSIDYLTKASKAGFNTMSYFATDADLDNVREDERFEAVIALVKNGGKMPKDDKKSAKATNKFAGTWKMISGKREGEDVPATRMPPAIQVDDENFTIPTPDPDQQFVMSYKIDESKTPMQIDFKIEEGPVAGGQAVGILKVENGKMTLCYDSTGQERPEKFETKEGDGRFLFVMEKAKPKFDSSKLIGEWTFVSGKRAGADVAADRLVGSVTLTKDKITIPAGPETTFVMSYKIDASKSPVQIDMAMESGPSPDDAKAVGIIKMTDGMFTLCYDMTGQNRPGKFESTEENKCFMFTMKPVTKKDD